MHARRLAHLPDLHKKVVAGKTAQPTHARQSNNQTTRDMLFVLYLCTSMTRMIQTRLRCDITLLVQYGISNQTRTLYQLVTVNAVENQMVGPAPAATTANATTDCAWQAYREVLLH